MLGDLRILDVGDELLLDTERVALQALFDMIRRFKIGYDVQLHKRTVERGLLSLIGPDGRTRIARPPRRCQRRSTRTARVEIEGIAALARPHRHRRGSPLRRRRPRTVREALLSAGREARQRGGRGDRPRRARPPPLRGRPRRDRIPQEAGLNERAVSFTKGCYVGQETVARLLLQGQAQPSPARPAPIGAGRRRARSCAWASAPSGA